MGTHICGAGMRTRTVLYVGVGWVWVELAMGRVVLGAGAV